MPERKDDVEAQAEPFGEHGDAGPGEAQGKPGSKPRMRPDEADAAAASATPDGDPDVERAVGLGGVDD